MRPDRVFSFLPKVTDQARWDLHSPRLGFLGDYRGVGVGSQLSLGHANAQKSLASKLEGSFRIIQSSPLTLDGELRPRDRRRVSSRVTKTASELGLTPDLLLPGTATFPVPRVALLFPFYRCRN